MVTAAQFEKIALSLAEVEKRPHFDRTAFRTPARTFTTLGPTRTEANVRLPLEVQDGLVVAMPDAFERLNGGWGAMGWTRMNLREVDPTTCRKVLEEAHAFAQVKKVRNARPARRTSGKRRSR